MEPSLDGANLRFKRSVEHIRSLRRMQARIAAIDRDSVVIHGNEQPPEELPDGSRRFYSPVLELPDLPPDNPNWAIRVGEAIYNMRAALDYLVYSLAYLDSRQPQEKTQFPIFDKPSAFKNAVHINNPKNPVRGVKDIHVTVLDGLQPYPTRNALDPLWLSQLADTSNPDKHRHLVLAEARHQAITQWTISRTPSGDGEMTVEFAFSRYIAFGDGDNLPVIPTLDSLRSHVRETLDEFKPCFLRKCPH